MDGNWTPRQAIEIYAGTAPGGGLDRTARALAAALESAGTLEVAVRVVNLPGDGARKVWSALDARAGDTHVLCISSPNLTTDFLTGASGFTHENYTPLAILYNEYIAFVARSDSSYRDAAGLLTRLRANASAVTVALSTAMGNPNHIALAQVVRHTGADVRAPVIRVFDSALDAVADVVAGNADVAAVTAASAVHELQAGTLRTLAVSAPERLTGHYAQCPTWCELGVACTLGAWRGVHGVYGLGPGQCEFWQSALAAATRVPAWTEQLARHYWTPMWVAGAALQDHLAQEHADMGATLDALGLKINK